MSFLEKLLSQEELKKLKTLNNPVTGGMIHLHELSRGIDHFTDFRHKDDAARINSPKATVEWDEDSDFRPY